MRDRYETPTSIQAVSSNELSQPPTQRINTSVDTVVEQHPGSRTDASRKGYWDIMSAFRSGNDKSKSQSDSYSRVQSEHLP